jgi:hypothetical protein
MPVMIVKALDCERTHGAIDPLQIKISADEKSTKKVKTTGRPRERSVLNKHVLFSKKVTVQLITAGTIKIGNTLTIDAERLPHIDNKDNLGYQRGLMFFKEGAAEYTLWYEVIPDGTSEQEFHRSAFSSNISLLRNLARKGCGALTENQRNSILNMNYESNEATSLRDVIAIHRLQDSEKGNTNSVRQWIYSHCNAWGEESPIPIAHLPEGRHWISLPSVPNYKTVIDESSCVLGGFVVNAEMSSADFGLTHSTRDITFDVLHSSQFNYLLAYTTFIKNVEEFSRISLNDVLLRNSIARPVSIRNLAQSLGIQPPISLRNLIIRITDFPPTRVPVIHIEWESGSMPKEWRPQAGEYVTVWGRHIFDLGHMPMKTEIHPVHSIIRERTLGDTKRFNRAIIGMGFSGGFPALSATTASEVKGRWDQEFGGYIDGLSILNRQCWPTNLKKHTLRKKLFPPVARPNRDAVLKERVNDYKLIFIRRSRINDFLKECKGGVGATDEVNKNFKDWFPDSMEEKPSPLGKPSLISRGDYFDLIVDLGNPQDIPVAYYAEIDIGWDL